MWLLDLLLEALLNTRIMIYAYNASLASRLDNRSIAVKLLDERLDVRLTESMGKDLLFNVISTFICIDIMMVA